MSDPWFMYVLRCGDNTLYAGVTKNISQRVADHRGSAKGAKYTRGRGPFDVVYWEEHKDRSSAQKNEAAFKKLKKKEKERTISEHLLKMWSKK